MNAKIFSEETYNVSLMQSFHSIVIYIPVDIGDKLNNLMKTLWQFKNEMKLCFFSEIASFLLTPSYSLNNRIMPSEGGVEKRYRTDFKWYFWIGVNYCLLFLVFIRCPLIWAVRLIRRWIHSWHGGSLIFESLSSCRESWWVWVRRIPM